MDRVRVDPDMISYGLRNNGHQALPLFFCAAPNDRFWHMAGLLDERHMAFDTARSCKKAFEDVCLAGARALAAESPEAGLSILSLSPAYSKIDLQPECAPAQPQLPFSNSKGGHWGCAGAAWQSIGPSLSALREALELHENVQTHPNPVARRAKKPLTFIFLASEAPDELHEGLSFMGASKN